MTATALAHNLLARGFKVAVEGDSTRVPVTRSTDELRATNARYRDNGGAGGPPTLAVHISPMARGRKRVRCGFRVGGGREVTNPALALLRLHGRNHGARNRKGLTLSSQRFNCD